MENPLELPAPPETDSIKRVEHFARDLAYGAITGLWGSQFKVINLGARENWFPSGDRKGEMRLSAHIDRKWLSQTPSSSVLISFGYAGYYATPTNDNNYCLLTQKAFDLLEKPSTPPSVFISYKQTESSALALLIESRIKHIDENVSIFIDKNIDSGESINSRIEEALKQSHFFICLLGPNTLTESLAVKTEIDLAKNNTDCTIIPICHSGYTPDNVYTQHFGDNKAIIIKQPDSAEEYETNMTKLLIRLGYSTI